MYEKFGNFDSVEEINECAEGILAAGNEKMLAELAKENGIPDFFVDNYLNRDSAGVEFTDWVNAAIGKLDVEAAGHKDKYVPVAPVVNYLKSLCIEEQFARCVRRRTKSVEACMAYIEKKTGELVRKGTTYVPDLTCFHWGRDYFLEGGGDR